MYYTPSSLNYSIAHINYKSALYCLESGSIQDYCYHMNQYRISIVNFRNE